MSFKRTFSLGFALLLTAGNVTLPAFADTVARANGRCSLKEDGYEAFNGYCTVKQKQNGDTTIFVVDLDNGNRFRFSGPGRQQLHVETDSGIGTNVLFEDQGSKGVFSWNDGSTTHRLAVKTDVVTNPNAQIDDHPSTATGASVTGALVGAIELNNDEFESLWKRGKSCVDVHRTNNRYTSITYSNPTNCN